MTFSTAPSRTALRRAAVCLLLLVVVLAQTLGWIHRGLHGSGVPIPGDAPSLHVDADVPHAGETFSGLFGGHSDASDCRLFDAVAQPGCAPSPLAVLPPLPLAPLLAVRHADFVARWAAPFHARGPPVPR